MPIARAKTDSNRLRSARTREAQQGWLDLELRIIPQRDGYQSASVVDVVHEISGLLWRDQLCGVQQTKQLLPSRPRARASVARQRSALRMKERQSGQRTLTATPSTLYERWLQPGDPASPPVDLLRPFDAAMLTAWKVTKSVGNVKNDTPDLLLPDNVLEMPRQLSEEEIRKLEDMDDLAK